MPISTPLVDWQRIAPELPLAELQHFLTLHQANRASLLAMHQRMPAAYRLPRMAPFILLIDSMLEIAVAELDARDIRPH
jgi:hypothetical protein